MISKFLFTDLPDDNSIHQNLRERSQKKLIVSATKAKIVIRRKRAATSRKAEAEKGEMSESQGGKSKKKIKICFDFLLKFDLFSAETEKRKRSPGNVLDHAKEIIERNLGKENAITGQNASHRKNRQLKKPRKLLK